MLASYFSSQNAMMFGLFTMQCSMPAAALVFSICSIVPIQQILSERLIGFRCKGIRAEGPRERSHNHWQDHCCKTDMRFEAKDIYPRLPQKMQYN